MDSPNAPELKNQTSNKNQLNLSVNLKWICALLISIIAVMLFLWQPWSSSKTSDRTISITGEATLKAAPDEYVFTPSYDFTNTNKEVALKALTNKSDLIVAKLKSLGVPDSKIKTNATGYDKGIYLPTPADNGSTYNLSLTVTLDELKLAQKVQDYLLTTKPSGAVSPQPSFSETKRKQLENQARDAATKDARSKAEQQAKNLGFKLGNVKSVTDGSGFPYPIVPGLSGAEPAQDTSIYKLQIQPGENELSYSITVVYFIR